MTCDPATTISAQDILDLKSDISTIDVVVESNLLTTTTKDSKVIDTLAGRLTKLGFQAPVTYAASIVFLADDFTKTIERNGIIYAPNPSDLPFTTSGTWVADDENKFFVIQGVTLYSGDLIIPKTTVSAMDGDANLLTGNVVKTEGYTTSADHGDNLYLIGSGFGIADGGSVIDLSASGLQAKALFSNGLVFAEQFGAIGDGAFVNTTVVAAAYAFVKLTFNTLNFGPGTFKGQYTFDGDAPVQGAGLRATLFTPSVAAWVIRLFGTGNSALGATLRDCTINGGAGLGTGLECGDAGGSGFSNGLVERLEISGFATNWNFSSAVMCTFNNIYTFSAADEGIKFGSERNVTTCTFNTVRSRLNDIGVFAQAGHNCVWNNCNIESNNVTGLKLQTGTTSGPTSWIFNGGDIENNGVLPGPASAELIASVYLDMQSGIGTTKPQNVLFNRTVITSPTGAFDVSAVRAEYAVFDHCAFSLVADGGFSATKFDFSTGTNAVRCFLKQCGTIQGLPTQTMYAAFPALFTATGGPFGFAYEFEAAGLTISNRELSKKVISTQTADLTSFDMIGLSTIVMDTTAGNLIVNSFINGQDGDVIRIIKTVSANTVTITHNGTGTEKIFTGAAANITLTGRQGMTLVHVDGNWYQADK